MRVPVERLVIAALLSGAWLASVVAGGLLVLDLVLGGGAVIGLFLPAVFGAVRGVRNFLADFDFTVAESTDGLHITRGLIDTRSQTLAEGRIQAVRITRPLLWRPFGWVKVSVNVAGYAPRSDGQVATTSTLLPVAPRAEADWLLRRVVPGLDIDLSRLSLAPAPRRARWIWPITYTGLGIALTERFVFGQEGLMGRDLSAMPLSKPQSLRLTQGPLQRKLQLATVHIDTTAGPVRMRLSERDSQEARNLFDWTVARSAEQLPLASIRRSDHAEPGGQSMASGEGEQGTAGVELLSGDPSGQDQ